MGSFENFAYNVLRLGVKRGRPPVFSAQQFYPAKEERELQETLKRELERLWTAALQVALQGIRDDVSDLAQIRAELSEDFVNNVNGIADKIIGNAQKSLVKFSEMTIGRPYYPGALEGSIKADWTATFQQLCISADTTAKAKIAQLVSQGKDQGMNKLQIEKLVKSELPADTAHRAELIARTETAKLNNAATMASYREAGIEYYKWLSCIDDRTRESHAKLNGKICAVGRPDVYFEENEENPLKPISHGRAGEGMYIGDPGTDFQCRCTCVPWDPRIDGKFEIKEAPEPKPKEPSKLEVAREETRKAVEKANEAEKKARKAAEAASGAVRKAEILQKANERHSKRTQEQRESIVEKRRVKNVTRELKGFGRSPEYIKNIFEIEKSLGVRYSGEMTHEKADTGAVNPKYGTDRKYGINCQTCVIVYELRRRGFDIQALPKMNAVQDVISRNSLFPWKNKDGSAVTFQDGTTERYKHKPRYNLSQKVKDIQSFMKENGRYNIGMAWKGNRSAHIISGWSENGELKFYDPQNNKIMNLETFIGLYLKNTSTNLCIDVIKVDDKMVYSIIDLKNIGIPTGT